ncbi:ABC transporter substrate-binding protein [Hydrogenibacillus schlegelii]|uniref:ABC transporter substrate-binding protein n=1 Tax=Hydrogenibacillus schlegelii TaxID=1484 RepID=A0A132MFW3_HYDSH|nr:ABC transporter substrate-binding protein [Hydrogenibacillus schlegelii]KWW96713.1 ABC transporter substrate-binding protein [Hydrogenibacillus schlegelii]OAR05338.1 ABC transporter substrate-binding protein [Hydrogenibacillus schlegelii]
MTWRNKKRLWRTLVPKLAVLLVFGLTACAQTTSDKMNAGQSESGTSAQNPNATEKTKPKVIGATQIIEHPSLDDAFRGFKAALQDAGFVEGTTVLYNGQNAQGDMNNAQTIARNFVADRVDLIFANSTPSAQAALNATKTIPIVFTSVTDPVGAGLVPSMHEAGENITGTTDTHPDAIQKMLAFIVREMGLKKIGIVYNPGEQNSVAQVDAIRTIIKAQGYSLDVVEASVSNTSEVKQAAESLVGQIEGYYVITDNTVVSALEGLLAVADANKLPVFTGEFDSLKRGGFAAYGFRYYDIGYQAGQMAALILKGERNPKDIPPEYPKTLHLAINKTVAKKLGIPIRPEWEKEAEFIE